MSDERLKFWAKCPDCKKPFGVNPGFVLKYLRRVIDDTDGRLEAIGELIADVEERVTRSAGEAQPGEKRRSNPHNPKVYGRRSH